MTFNVKTVLMVGGLLSISVSSMLAGDLTSAATGDARTKVATAVALANIAKSSNDGEALLVAARLLTEAGPVAEPGTQVKDGKPTLIDVGAMAGMAKDMGADAAKAEALSKGPTSSERSGGYWYYSCDSYNNCQWIYAGW